MNKVYHRSQRHDYETPDWLFNWISNHLGRFDWDLCATNRTSKCGNRFFSKKQDALSRVWPTGTLWMNPPYGKNIGDWVRAASLHAMPFRRDIAVLLPSRTDTQWWHQYVMGRATKVWFIKNRLCFKGSAGRAPFPSCIVWFTGKYGPPKIDVIVNPEKCS